MKALLAVLAMVIACAAPGYAQDYSARGGGGSNSQDYSYWGNYGRSTLQPSLSTGNGSGWGSSRYNNGDTYYTYRRVIIRTTTTWGSAY